MKLRQAINWAIDRPAQVRIAGKFGGRRTSQILPPAMPGFKQANNIYAYNGANPAKAKQVAGDVSKVPTAADRALATRPSNINAGQVMRFNLEAIGLKARTEPIPSAQLFSRSGDRKGNYDLLRIGWQADYPDPSNFINVLLDGRAFRTRGRATTRPCSTARSSTR